MIERIIETLARNGRFARVLKRMGQVTLQTVEPEYQVSDLDDETISQGTQKDYLQLYQSLIWAFRGISTIASAASSVPYLIQKGGEDYSVHPVNKLLFNPNEVYTTYQLFHRTYSYLMIVGNAYWFIETNEKGLPKAIHVPRPDRIKIRSQDDYYDTYARQVWPGKYVVHFTEFNPLSELEGFGPLMATQSTAILDLYLSSFAKDWFERAIYPSQTYKTDKVLSSVAYERFLAKMRKLHQGYEKFHDVLLLEGGIEPVDIKQGKPSDSEFVDSRRLTREEILAALGCYHLVALLNRQGSTSLRESKRMFWEEMLPRLTNVSATITKDLIWKLYPDSEDVAFRYDVRQISGLRDSFLDESLAYYRLWMVGAITPNEIRERLAISGKLAWGDRPPPSFGVSRSTSMGITREEQKTAEMNHPHLERYVDQLAEELRERIDANDGQFDESVKDEFLSLFKHTLYEQIAEMGL